MKENPRWLIETLHSRGEDSTVICTRAGKRHVGVVTKVMDLYVEIERKERNLDVGSNKLIDVTYVTRIALDDISAIRWET